MAAVWGTVTKFVCGVCLCVFICFFCLSLAFSQLARVCELQWSRVVATALLYVCVMTAGVG